MKLPSTPGVSVVEASSMGSSSDTDPALDRQSAGVQATPAPVAPTAAQRRPPPPALPEIYEAHFGTVWNTLLAAAKLAAAAGAGGGAAAATGAAASSAVGKGLAIALAVTMVGTTATGVYLAQQDDTPPSQEVAVDVEEPPGFDPAVLGARPASPPLPPPAPVVIAPAPVLHDQRPAVAPVEATPEERAARLAAERGLLDEARGAVARGNGGAALIALEAHRASFPDGQLVEEREAITVLALAKVGRLDEARDKAHRFTRRWPRSLFATAVEQAVSGP